MVVYNDSLVPEIHGESHLSYSVMLQDQCLFCLQNRVWNKEL